jgi:copper resistance protein D
MEYALYACRFVQFAAAMVVFGSSVFRFYALGGEAASAGRLAAFDVWSRGVALVAAILALVSALGLLLCQSGAMAGAPAAALDPATVSAVLFETRFGRVWSWHLLIALVLVLACSGRTASGQKLVLILSFLLLASLAWTGHAAMEEGLSGIGHALNQTAHLLSAGLWLGGLVPLGWLLRRARATRKDADLILARDATRHFSQMGYAAVAVIALTGAINTMLLVGSLDAMFGAPYGRLLAFKVLLFALMTGIALINRFRLAPRVSRDPAALNAFCRTIGLEQALGLAILAAVSILGTWPPAVHQIGQ